MPAGLTGAIEEILRRSPGAVRRRPLLEELERAGHRVSLAGLNRALQELADAGRVLATEDGVRLPGPSSRR